MNDLNKLNKSQQKKEEKKYIKLSKKEIINQAFKLHSQGNIVEATKCYEYLIDTGFKEYSVFINYGIILKSQGKLKEAELSLRKAIEIKPDSAETYYNLGNTLREIGNLKEAEISTRKAIELKPDLAVAYSNLGGILKNLDKLKEAEISTRKAIELKPNLAIAYSNLGAILRIMGKLNEAEISTRKAIELKPDIAETYSKLGIILRDLGKSHEMIILSKSLLKLKSIDKGDKLQASLEIAITNLLQGDFSETLLNLNKTNKLIREGGLNFIKNKLNKKQISVYTRFISLLYPQLEKKYHNPKSKRIPHIGESHCLSFSHQTICISSEINKIQPVLIRGGKAWHFAEEKHNQWKDSLIQQISNHTYSKNIFISFGEIDCRKDEGILSYAIKKEKNISEICHKTINSYLNYMEKILSQNYTKRYYFGVPAPMKKKESYSELDFQRIKLIKNYNLFLKKEVLSRGSYFLDVYALTSNNDGENNNLHMCDDIHLSPQCLSILFKKNLHEP